MCYAPNWKCLTEGNGKEQSGKCIYDFLLLLHCCSSFDCTTAIISPIKAVYCVMMCVVYYVAVAVAIRINRQLFSVFFALAFSLCGASEWVNIHTNFRNYIIYCGRWFHFYSVYSFLFQSKCLFWRDVLFPVVELRDSVTSLLTLPLNR